MKEPEAHCRPCRRHLILAALAGLSVSLAAPARADGAQRIMVIGDSQAQGLAGALQRLFRGDRSYRVLDRSKISTGLVVRNNYDWPTVAARLAVTERPDVAIVMFGANDRPPGHVHSRPELGQGFRDTYGANVQAVVAALAQVRCPVLWVGHPVVRDAAFADDILMLNEIYQDYAVLAGAEWIPTWQAFLSPAGAYTQYGPGVDGLTTKLRADDGVHMTPAGYDVIARLLLPFLEQRHTG